MVKDSVSAVKFLDSLAQNNYYNTRMLSAKLENDTIKIRYQKGKNYNEGYIQFPNDYPNESEILLTKNIDSVKQNVLQYYKNLGYAFSRLQTTYVEDKKGYPSLKLNVVKNNKRIINGIVIKGYTQTPKRFLKNIEKEYVGKIYDDKNLITLTKNFQNHPFVRLERAPQSLFTKDSTQVFLFLEKKKTNSFDGVIGFGNDKTEKFTLNGTLNVNFRNIFNSFETVNFYWQRSPDKGQAFDIQADVPYLFNTSVGTNLKINIFRQDSSFANVKLLPAFYYHINSRIKLGLRATLETSSILNALYTQGKDYTKKGVGLFFDMTTPSDIDLFMYQSKVNLGYDYLHNIYSAEQVSSGQNQVYLFGEYNKNLIGNHFLNLKIQGALMDSKVDFSVNELYRFGGWNSLRGFNENSLLANFYYFGGLEYRYLVGNQAFFDVFGQYGKLYNSTLNLKPKLYSVGLGFNFFIPIGLMSFQLSNGNEFGNPFKINEVKIHWGLLSKF